MFRKALVLAGVILALNLIWTGQPVQAQDEPSTFVKASEGVSATTNDWKQGKVEQFFDGEILRLIWGNFAMGYQYQVLEVEGDAVTDHAVRSYYFLHSPKHQSKLVSPYFFFAPSLTQGIETSDSKLGEGSWALGFGILLPDWETLKSTNFLFEIGYKNVNKESVLGLSFGTMFGRDP